MDKSGKMELLRGLPLIVFTGSALSAFWIMSQPSTFTAPTADQDRADVHFDQCLSPAQSAKPDTVLRADLFKTFGYPVTDCQMCIIERDK